MRPHKGGSLQKSSMYNRSTRPATWDYNKVSDTNSLSEDAVTKFTKLCKKTDFPWKEFKGVYYANNMEL